MYYYNDSYYSNDYLQHYGVKGMKWGVRRAERYESKAKKYRAKASEYNSKNVGKFHKYKSKAETMDVKAKLAREGKDDIKKLRAAGKLKGHYTDTQGLMRGPLADAVGDIRAKKGERYASELLRKYQSQEYAKLTLTMAGASAAYAAGMAFVISAMDD